MKRNRLLFVDVKEGSPNWRRSSRSPNKEEKTGVKRDSASAKLWVNTALRWVPIPASIPVFCTSFRVMLILSLRPRSSAADT